MAGVICCQTESGGMLRTCFRNPRFAKFFLAVNAIIFIYAISRMYFSTLEQADTIATIKHAQSSNTRALKSLQDVAPCDCHGNEVKLKQLQFTINNLTKTAEKERQQQINFELECDKKVKKCHNTNDQNSKTVLPNKLGEDKNSSSEYQVPNLVHYIWYSTEPKAFEFHHMLSVLSVDKFIKPDAIYFHTDNPPIGKYWDRVKNLPRLKINKREPPSVVFRETIKPPMFHTSHSNVDRVLVLMEYGGIYMDLDFIAVRSFDDLRRHVCTVGLESDTKVCGSVIVCSKQAFFLYLWINAYIDDYRIDEWAYNTGQVPFNLAKRYPHLINVEKTRLNRPNFQELSEIWVKPTWWNWRDNYGFHSWYRLWKDNWGGYFTGIEPDENNVKTLNNTFAEIARVILYDSPNLLT